MPPSIEAITEQIGRQYLLMAFLVALGAVQIAASIAGLRGMMLLPGRRTARALGIALLFAGIAVFYLMPLWVDGPWASGSVEADSSTREWGRAGWSDLGTARNVNDVDGGLSGTDHARWFPIAAALALAVSLAGGTLAVRLFPPSPSGTDSGPDVGLGNLSEMSYAASLRSTLPELHRTFLDDARAGLAAHPGSIFGRIAKLVSRRP